MNVNLSINMENCSEMDNELHLTIYRIVQEQLTNIIKYAKASIVDVKLEHVKGMVQLLINDNGVGFDTSQKTNGIGLTNMRSRAAILGGNVEIESLLNKGTTVTVQFPVRIIGDKCMPAEVTESIYPGL
jgi:two-component system, NarL family, sensor kinase